MDDGYQDVIRGSPVDRKPDRVALDAALEAMFLNFDSAAQIYCQLAVELEEAVQSGQGIHREFVKQLLLKHKVFCRALPSKIDLIVAEKR
jgi:hypothetical protein